MQLLGPHGYGGSMGRCKEAGVKQEQEREGSLYWGFNWELIQSMRHSGFCTLAMTLPF